MHALASANSGAWIDLDTRKEDGMQLLPPFRRATPDDAHALAEIVNFASEGLALYLWTRTAGPVGDPWQIGRERAARADGNFSYRNGVVVEVGGRIAAGLVSYPLPITPEPIPDTMPPMFVPLQELQNLVPATWYVNILAAYPEHRSNGHGTALLALAEEFAAQAGCRGLSIIVSDTNTGARRLYERCGYHETAQRPKVKEGWDNPGTMWVLLTKPLSG
jgi:ribosomal protein S18 acetylase RimI-like enzyme